MDILLVEDDRLDAETVDIVLRRGRESFIRIEHATTLEAGLAALEERRFDVALVDLNLPDAVGAEAVERIVQARFRLPVVVLSGNSDEEFAISVIRAGAQDFVVKGSKELSSLYRTLRYSIERKSAELRLRHLASFDSLTNLANRQELYHQLEKACARSDRHGDMVALLLLDLDRFKLVNDIHGHTAGDNLLRVFAERLSRIIRKGDTAARLGGDEFAVVLEGIPSTEIAIAWGERALDEINQPFADGGIGFPVSASIGGALYPSHGADVDALMRSADIAMYKVKRSGRNGLAFYDEHMDRRVVRRQVLEADLRRALDDGQIQPYLQPKLDLTDMTVCGFEAISRWVRPDGEVISPAEFLPIVRGCGLIQELGERLRERLLRYLGSASHTLPVSVNVDALELASRDFASEVIDQIEGAGFNARTLSLEITETVLLDGDGTTAANLDALRDYGIEIELDDFGAGHSSLNYLRQFHVDVLKIDRGLISGLGQDDQGNVILNAVIRLAGELGLRVVAEGIETVGQLRAVEAMNCHVVQGYLIARPMPLAEVDGWLADGADALAERLLNMTGTVPIPPGLLAANLTKAQ